MAGIARFLFRGGAKYAVDVVGVAAEGVEQLALAGRLEVGDGAQCRATYVGGAKANNTAACF